MHPEAMDWVRRFATAESITVLDIGGRNINGTPRPLFTNADPYNVLDVRDGLGVDLVADASGWQPHRQWDLVLCCETLEHTDAWREICATAFRACRPGGRLVVTTAAPGRPVHSGVDGGPILHPGESYANIDPNELGWVLHKAGFEEIQVDVQPTPADVRATARKPADA